MTSYQATADRPVAPLLASYYYFARADIAQMVAKAADAGVRVDLLADSGAFSAYTSGATITVKQYAAWLITHAQHITAAATLDVIGDPAATARNTKELEQLVAGAVYIIPTFHVGSPWPELEAWCASHTYIGLGGAVHVTHRDQALRAWLTKAHRIGRAAGAVFHGFGLTKPPIPSMFPWYSVDSAYWGSASRTGTLGLFDPATGTFRRVKVGSQQVYERSVTNLVRSYGADPAQIAARGFGRVAVRGARGRAERHWMDRVAVESWRRYGEHLRAIRPPVAAGARSGIAAGAGDGPKLYLAVGSAPDFDMVSRVAARGAATIDLGDQWPGGPADEAATVG